MYDWTFMGKTSYLILLQEYEISHRLVTKDLKNLGASPRLSSVLASDLAHDNNMM